MRKSIGFLGGGQLGMMMGQAAQRLGFEVGFLDPSSTACARQVGRLVTINAKFDEQPLLEQFAQEHPFVTYEWENVPPSAVEFLASRVVKLYPNIQALKVASDRLKEKQLFVRLGIPVPQFYPVETYLDLVCGAEDCVGFPLILKTRFGGYDGIGQTLVNQGVDDKQLLEIWTQQSKDGSIPLIAEAVVEFDDEVSQIAARSEDGTIVYYPLMRNFHQQGILRYTQALPAGHALEGQAQKYAGMIMEHLGYVGVMCVEFFNVAAVLYANEIAPRVHNSGHLTIEAATTSQFENHIRALAGLPLGATDIRGYAGMVNIIGTHPFALLKHPQVFWHIYGKQERARRKLGHVTVVSFDYSEYQSLISQLIKQANAEVNSAPIF